MSNKTNTPKHLKKSEKSPGKIAAIISVILAVLIVGGLLFWDSGIIQKNAAAYAVGDKKYTAADVDFYYFNQYNSIAPYASYIGLDTSKSLKKQQSFDGKTWHEYLCDATEDELSRISAVAQEAKKANYKISDAGQKQIDEETEYMDSTPSDSSVDPESYLKQTYGRFASKKTCKKMLEEYYYAMDYQDSKLKDFKVTDKEILEYYKNNAKKIDTYLFTCYSVNAEPEIKYDNDGNPIEATKEEKQKAAEDALETAKQIEVALVEKDNKALKKLTADTSKVTKYTNLPTAELENYSYYEWLTDDSRKGGDVAVIGEYADGDSEGTSTDSEDPDSSADSSSSASDNDATKNENAGREATAYYTMQFKDHYLDQYKGANAKIITVEAPEIEDTDNSDSDSEDTEATYDFNAAKKVAKSLEAKFKKAGSKLDAFENLSTFKDSDAEDESVDEEVQDTTSKKVKYSGTNYKSIAKDTETISEDVVNWLFSDTHKAGDYTRIESQEDNAIYLVYFTGYDSRPKWKDSVEETIRQNDLSEWIEKAMKEHPSKKTTFFSLVG